MSRGRGATCAPRSAPRALPWRAAFLSLLLSLPVLAGVIGADVEREIRARGVAHVIVAMRDNAPAPSLTSDEFAIEARFHHANAFAGTMREAAIAKLAGDPNVLRVDVDSAGSGHLAESVPLIGGNIVREMGYTGKGVTVAILDSGIDLTHPDLAGRIVDQQCFCTNANGTGCCPNAQTTQSGDGAAADDHGHGTNVSGIVASKGTIASFGVAPDVKLVAVKVLDKNNAFSSTAQVLAALEWLYDAHPEVQVVNMSLGTNAAFEGYCDNSASFATAQARVIDKLRARGTLVFSSTGNNSSSKAIGVPACLQNAVSVGAVYDGNNGSVTFTGVCTDATTTADQITCFTQSNVTLDLLAPGARITSTGRGSTRSTFIGTSQASPHCAGAAAVLLEVQRKLTPDQIESILKATGKPILDARNGVTIPRIDLLAAVQSVKNAHTRRRGASH
jgi:subtilisin family serine protease